MSSEVNAWYEDASRQKLPVILWTCFSLACREPAFCWEWAAIPSTCNGEVDFLAHSVYRSDISLITTNAIPHVTVAISPNQNSINLSGKSTSEKSSSFKVPSPEKLDTNGADLTDEHDCYVIGEVACGGETSVKGKLEQLERDCVFILAKTQQTDILNVVNAAVVINQKDFTQYAFDYIGCNPSQLPHLSKLYKDGRFIYVQYSITLTRLINNLGERIDRMEQKLNRMEQKIYGMEKKIDSLCALFSQSKSTSGEEKQEQRITNLKEIVTNLKKIIEIKKRKGRSCADEEVQLLAALEELNGAPKEKH
jgi:hypothetical protein